MSIPANEPLPAVPDAGLRRRALMLGFGACGLPLSSLAGTVWQMPTGYRANLFQAQNLEWFAAEVARRTAGELRIEIRPNNSMLRLAEIPGALSSGRVAAGEVLMSGLAADVPVAGADALPFVVRDYRDALRMWTYQRPTLQRAFDAKGWRVLFAVPWPPQGLFSKQPVSKPADFKGLRMRVYNAATQRIAEMLGAQPVNVPMTDLPAALADDRIDTMITSALTGVDSEIWRFMKYYYDIWAWLPKNVVLVRDGAWKALTATQQAAVEEAAGLAERRGWALSERAAADSMTDLQNQGLSVNPMPGLLGSPLRTMGERFSLEWLRAVGWEANEIFVPYFSPK